MARYYWLRRDDASASRYTGYVNAVHRWGLPGVHCSTCGATWGGGADSYPSVDLSGLTSPAEFEDSSPRPLVEFARLCEQVRPLLPQGTPLLPGTRFGPLTGTAMGTFGPLSFQNSWTLLVHREVLERLQVVGVRGLTGYPT
ncbi:double-CXXCG motif protein, partial [Archangium sp.]|uniref:SitI6 family double-CXXCG motif immunity protein n=1 Tax=Archangium sp. TaxID=1872627 RepID=UPI0039C8A493